MLFNLFLNVCVCVVVVAVVIFVVVVVVNFLYPSISYYLLISFCFYCNLGAV